MAVVQRIDRFGRRAGVGVGSTAGALVGACLGLWFGLYLGLLAGLAAWRLGASSDPAGDVLIAAFVAVPLSMLAGAFLGAKLFSGSEGPPLHCGSGTVDWAGSFGTLGGILVILGAAFALAIFVFVVGSMV
jgi:hypothetical protein